MIHSEEWRSWRSGDYEVSSLGRVRRARPGKKTTPGRMLKPTLLKIGYWSVAPVVDGRNVRTCVHAMVAECFLGPRPKGHEINHRDGVKTNNCVLNLEYVTHAENMRHAGNYGLMVLGEKHPSAKLTVDLVRAIRARRAMGASYGVIAGEFRLSIATAFSVANRRSWRHVA